MFFRSNKGLCGCCHAIVYWLKGLTLLTVGIIGILQQLNVFKVSPWGWTWPVIVIVWGLVVLFNIGCKQCNQ